MNAPIADQIKAEAAKSILERMAEKTKLVKFFRYNASAKHGVPIDNDDVSIDPLQPTPESKVEPEPKAESKTNETTTIIKDTKVVEKKDGDQLKGILQALAAVAVVAAALWGGTKLAQSTSPTNNQSITQPYIESPFQYLEDQGEHLP